MSLSFTTLSLSSLMSVSPSISLSFGCEMFFRSSVLFRSVGSFSLSSLSWCDVTQPSRDRAANTLKHLRSLRVDFFIFTEKHCHITHGFKLKETHQDVLMSHTWRCSSRARSSGWWGRPCSWTSPLGFWAQQHLCPPSPGSRLYPNPPESHKRSHGRFACQTHTAWAKPQDFLLLKDSYHGKPELLGLQE